MIATEMTLYPANNVRVRTLIIAASRSLSGNRIVLAVAANSGAHQQKAQLCEANFFAGEDALLRQRHMAAKALFQTALDVGPKTNLHFDAAAAEMRQLNAVAVQGARLRQRNKISDVYRIGRALWLR